jgi:hypothetical protein
VPASRIMSAAKSKEEATKALHPDLPAEDAWFDPINSEEELLNEEEDGENQHIESWHSFGTF